MVLCEPILNDAESQHTSGTTLCRRALGFRTMRACPRRTVLTSLKSCPNEESVETLPSSSEDVSGSTSIVPTPKTPLEATETVRPVPSIGSSSSVEGRTERGDPVELSWGSVLKNGMGSTGFESRDDTVVVLG